MTRYLYGGDDVEVRSTPPYPLLAGGLAYIWTNSACTAAATLLDPAGVPIVGNALQITGASQLPVFQCDNQVQLYVRVGTSGPISTVYPVETSILASKADLSYVDAQVATRMAASLRGAANGVASLDATSLIPVAQVPDLSATYASQSAMQNLQNSVPSIEELLFSMVLVGYPNGAAMITTQTVPFTVSVFVAPFPLQILSIRFAWDYWTLAASDTAYWSFTPTVYPAAGGATVAMGSGTTKTTPSGGMGSIAPRKSITMPNLTSPNMTTQDVLTIVHAPTGGPAALAFTEAITVGYSPL